MANKKKEKRPHLGKGLEALLGSTLLNNEAGPVLSDQHGTAKFPPDKELRDSVATIPTEDIQPNPYQPRTTWDTEELNDLAESIRENGIIQPILVRKVESGFEIIAGERRWRAAQLAQLNKVPALIRQADDGEMLELALVENIHRVNLNPMERASAYQQYIETFSLSQTDAAKRLGEDRSVVANYLRLLSLPQEVKQMLIDGALSMGHARALLSLPTDDLQKKLANRAMAGRLSVREVEAQVRKSLQGSKDPKQIVEKPAHLVDLENRLRDALGTKVRINARKNGSRGKIIIDFYSLDEFDRLTEKIGLTNVDDMPMPNPAE